MALRQRKVVETDKLFGVNLVAEDFKLQFGWFEQLTNWVPIPDEVFSIQKKRGVSALSSGAVVTVVLSACP